jgi:hypothetical protein
MESKKCKEGTAYVVELLGLSSLCEPYAAKPAQRNGGLVRQLRYRRAYLA